MRLESVVKNLVKKNWCGKKQITSADTSASTLQTTLEDFCYEVEVGGKVTVSHLSNLNWTLERTPEISQKIFDEHFIHRGILELLASYLWTTTTTLSQVLSPLSRSLHCHLEMASSLMSDIVRQTISLAEREPCGVRGGTLVVLFRRGDHFVLGFKKPSNFSS